MTVSRPPAYLKMKNWVYYTVTLVIWIAVIVVSVFHPDLAFVNINHYHRHHHLLI